MKYHCCDLVRLEMIAHGTTDVNAIEFLEVLDRGAPPGVLRQQTLFVRLLRPTYVVNGQTVSIGQLGPANLDIRGGERIERVGIVWCAPAETLPAQAEAGLVDSIAATERPRTLVVRTDSAGDFSSYTLAIVSGVDDARPPGSFDPKLSSVGFSFKVECPSPFDCLEPPVCAPEMGKKPVIDYLAKDYDGFRRLMSDRLSLLVPDWTERSAADLGVALVELLAYAADNLSYRQDVIANEAYLNTARLRPSVRRLTRLVGYSLPDGSNARAFVQFQVEDSNPPSPVALVAGTELLTMCPGLPSAVPAQDLAQRREIVRNAVNSGAQVFLTGRDETLHQALNEISLYTWGDQNCCLPRGSTRATLRGDVHAELLVGGFLLLEEVLDPQQTEVTGDVADKSHRWVVRLTKVTANRDPSGRLFDPTPTPGPVDVTEVEWHAADALPFPLCLSAKGKETAVARGNIVLADHGYRVDGESLGKVPPGQLAVVAESRSPSCQETQPVLVPPRFRPTLQRGPLTQGFDLEGLLAAQADGAHVWPASALLEIEPRTAMPCIMLTGVDENGVQEPFHWTPRRDLLDSSAEDVHFVVETEHDGRAKIRFGDDTHGKRPNSGFGFLADYRLGNGKSGNVGIGAITHVVGIGRITQVRNPLAASGGVEPEDVEVARRDAPHAFRVQERAVTAEDYATLAERLPDVQRASARFRWTGSWHTAFVTADRYGGATVDPSFATRLRGHLERYRMAGYDLHADNPRYVPLDLALHVCVNPRYQSSEVLREVKRVLSSSVLPDGRRGLFHPDRFTFGSAVYLSPIVAAAQAVTGVDSVRVDRFQRLEKPDPASLGQGVIPIGPLEIAQLENSPTFPDRGRLKLYAGGDQ